MSEAALETIVQLLGTPDSFFHFSSVDRYLCHFRFPDLDQAVEKTIYSDSVNIPGGFVRLFMRPLPLLDSDSLPSCVVGIQLESDRVWILRVASISNSKRPIELKAGCTKADVLRVPNGGRGTWSDLLPTDMHVWNNDAFFLIEFI